MHYFFKSSHVTMLRLSALFWILSILLYTTSFVIAILLTFQPAYMVVALWSILASFLLASILYAFTLSFSSKATCPLCRSSIFTSSGTARRPKARPVLGSVRTGAALSIVFTGQCYCPYCAEKIRLQARSMEERDSRRNTRQH